MRPWRGSLAHLRSVGDSLTIDRGATVQCAGGAAVKPKLIVLIGLALVCLVLAGFALDRPQTAESRAAEAVSAGGHYQLSGADLPPGPSRQYRTLPKGGELSGGDYRLAGTTQSEVKAIASGGKYRLAAPEGSENGCCCMFLPCVSK